jgi:DNA-binding GntR family transcriptional regulator
VSQTPVRKALTRLSELGGVETQSNHTAAVRHLGLEERVHCHQVREALEGMAAELAFARLTAEDFVRLDAPADAAGDQQAVGRPRRLHAFNLDLYCIVTTRSDNPILTHEIVKLLSPTLMIYEQLELVLIRSGRLIPDDRLRIRKTRFNQHMEIIALLRDGRPSACRRARLDSIRFNCGSKVGLMPETARQDAWHRPTAAGRPRISQIIDAKNNLTLLRVAKESKVSRLRSSAVAGLLHEMRDRKNLVFQALWPSQCIG